MRYGQPAVSGAHQGGVDPRLLNKAIEHGGAKRDRVPLGETASVEIKMEMEMRD